MKKLLNDLFNYISWTLYEGKKLAPSETTWN
jgi:hypothetical protein